MLIIKRKNTVLEINNPMGRLSSGVEIIRDRICELGDKSV